MGKLAILRENNSYFQGKIIPQREKCPSEGKITQFSLGGKILPQKMFRVVWGLRIFVRKMLRNFPWNFLSLYFVGPKKTPKIPLKFPAKFPSEKSKRIHRRASAGAQGEGFSGRVLRSGPFSMGVLQ